MTTFRAFFILEFKRFLSLRNAAVMLLFLCLCLWLVNFGVTHYRDLKKGSKEFQDVVNEKVKQFPTYDMYGGYGIHLYFMPARTAILFHNSGLFSQLICRMDVGEILDAYDLFKGKNIFAEKPGKLLDFSGFFLLLGSLMAMFYGLDAFRHKEYLRFLSSLFGHCRVFALLWLSRAILMSLYFTSVTLCAFILFQIFGINLSGGDFGYLALFLMTKLLLLIFFFSVGCLTGGMKSLRAAGFFMVIFWLISTYFISATVNKIVEAGVHNMTSNFKSELDKLTTLMDFEKWAIKELKRRRDAGKQVSREELPKFYMSYFKRIQDIDRKILAETTRWVDRHHMWSLLFPSSFYISVNNELSSRGYRNLLDFYNYAFQKKGEFVEYYVEKRPEDMKADKDLTKVDVQPFTGIEEIFQGKSRLPSYFAPGLVLMLLYILGFSYWSYAAYKRTLFFVPFVPKEEDDGLQDLKIEIEKGVANVVLTRGVSIKHSLYNVLSGKGKGFKGQILVEGVNIGMVQREVDFVYLCHPGEIPGDIKPGDFILFILGALQLPRGYLLQIAEKLKFTGQLHKHLNDLGDEQTGAILLEVAPLMRQHIYLLDNFARGLAGDFVQEFRNRMNQLKADGAAILYLTNDVFLGRKLGDYILSLKKEAALLRVNL